MFENCRKIDFKLVKETVHQRFYRKKISVQLLFSLLSYVLSAPGFTSNMAITEEELKQLKISCEKRCSSDHVAINFNTNGQDEEHLLQWSGGTAVCLCRD